MTDLQVGLAVIGVLAVALVLAYNWLQERRAKRAAERAFASGNSDVLLDEPRGRREPTLGAPGRPAPLQAEATPDARIDYIMKLSVPGGAPTPLLRELWSPIEFRFARRALLDGAGSTMCAALQLVSRAGAVSDAELLEFRSAVETLAAKLGATVSAPEMREALDAARELDRACADVDIQVALHVIGIPEVSQVESAFFSAEPRPDGVTLTLDVARTTEPRRAYEAMARTGMQLAAAGGGRIVDDNGTALDERALAAIGGQLDAVIEMLSARGIEPGSALALRLFS
ncbi:MAG TPA: cell division protein ZipA C-terminal FtsZ-binding domain-containing protein [Burkholderiales bacterium]